MINVFEWRGLDLKNHHRSIVSMNSGDFSCVSICFYSSLATFWQLDAHLFSVLLKAKKKEDTNAK